MVNIVDSIGFDLERVHTGLVVYLVNLWQNNKGSLLPFFDALDVDLRGHEEIRAKKEYENVDLVLCDQNDELLVAIEMKVHNYESRVPVKGSSGERNYQTIEYPKRVGDCHFLYVTLGVGEYYRQKPYGDVPQIGLNRFHAAVEAVVDKDDVIRAWETSLKKEKEFRAACRHGEYRGIDRDEARKCNLYFLGFLRNELEGYWSQDLRLDPTVYSSGPDTILNFGVQKGPCYVEINNNGRLNLKINLESLNDQDAKQESIEKAARHYSDNMDARFKVEANRQTALLKKSKTIASFDIALERKEKAFLTYTAESLNETCKRISYLVGQFCHSPVFRHP